VCGTLVHPGELYRMRNFFKSRLNLDMAGSQKGMVYDSVSRLYSHVAEQLSRSALFAFSSKVIVLYILKQQCNQKYND